MFIGLFFLKKYKKVRRFPYKMYLIIEFKQNGRKNLGETPERNCGSRMNKEEFSKQVLNAESSLYRVAKSILHNDEDCADAIQNGILKAFQKLDTLRNDKYFKTWLTRIVINECYQIIRYAKKHAALEEYPGWDEESAWMAEEESQVMSELMQLDEKYRIPIVLHEIEGYSAKEIGKMLDLSETNVRNRLFRGKAVLRKKLEGVV